MLASTAPAGLCRPQPNAIFGVAPPIISPHIYLGCTRRAGRGSSSRALSQARSVDTSQLQPLKKRIQQEVGVKYGFDKSTSERQSIEQLIEQLVALNPTEEPAGMDLTGTSWRPIYTTSTGTSGGKLGPFIAEVSQDFPADQPGFYFNKLALGPLRAELLADYKKVRADRLDVEFKYTDFFLGPFKRRQEFPPGRMRGYWRIAYSDGDMRVFYTNKGSLFVLVRVQQ